MKTNLKGHGTLSRQQLASQLKLWGVLVISSVASLSILSATAPAAPPWSPPVMLSAPAVNAQSPAVAVNDSGAMVAAWARQEGFIYNVQASTFSNGVWSTAVNLSAAGQTAVGPSVAIAANGVATALWTTGQMVQASTFTPGGGWSAPVQLSDLGASVLSPQVVVDGVGNLTAMWVRYDLGGAPGIETADRPAGGNWTAPLLLAAGAPSDYTLVANAAGDTALVWNIGSFVSSTAVLCSTRTPGGQWEAAYVVAPGAYRQGGGRIGIDAFGNVTVCWRTNTEIRVADKPAGGSWGVTKTIFSNLATSDYPTLAVTPGGDAMAAFITYVYSGGGYNYTIRTSVRAAESPRWSKAAALTSKKEYDLELHAATTPGGTFVLTWVDSNRLQLKSSTRTIATAWSPAAVIAIGGSDTALAVAGQTAAAIWMGGSFQATVSTAPVSP
jgi:hypothetical protein